MDRKLLERWLEPEVAEAIDVVTRAVHIASPDELELLREALAELVALVNAD